MTAAQPDAASAPVAAPVPPGRLREVLDTVLRVFGGVVAVALAMVTAVIEIFYAPLRVGGVLIGASVLVAVVANYWLLRYTVAVTGSGWAGLLPPAAWFALMLAAANRRQEGDLLFAAGNWVALVTIFLGSLAFAVAGYKMLIQPSANSRL